MLLKQRVNKKDKGTQTIQIIEQTLGINED